MSHTFIIIDDNQDDVAKTQAIAERFRNLSFLAAANNYDIVINGDGLEMAQASKKKIMQDMPEVFRTIKEIRKK
jgi:hypothetical protein